MALKKSQTVLDLSKGIVYLLLLAYGAYVIGISIQKNYNTNEQIKSLRQDIASLQEEINDLKNTIIYYQTDSFKELEARRRLGLKGAGETMVMLPKKDEPTTDQTAAPRQERNSFDEENISNPIKWYRYIFD